MLIFARSYLSTYDARMGKYFHVMERLGVAYAFIGWQRDAAPYQAEAYEILYRRPARLGVGWKNSIALLAWNLFVLRTLLKHRREVSAVHAVDLDTALACYVFCLVSGKPFIFDIYDKYTAVRNIGGAAGRTLDWLERKLARRAQLTLLAGEDRFEQMRLPDDLENCLVLENVPLAQVTATALPKFDGTWRIGYFGVLEPVHRGLEDLMRVAARRADVELHLAGYGGLEAVVAEHAAAHENIHFHGPMSSAAGLKLMAQMHVVAGFYYLSVPNHAYAAPNKYFEHLMLGRGMLTTADTSPGRKVQAFSTGWAIPEGEEALSAWVSQLSLDDVNFASIAARSVWDRHYQHYFEDHYVSIYGVRVADMVTAAEHD